MIFKCFMVIQAAACRMMDMKRMKMNEFHVLPWLDLVHRTGARVNSSFSALFGAISFTPFLFFMVQSAVPQI